MTEKVFMRHIESCNIRNHAILLRDFLLDLFFPLECAGCGSEGAWLCEKCFAGIKFEVDQPCFVCKAPHRAGRTCNFCQAAIGFDYLLAATNYDSEIVARLIKLLKYKFAKTVAPVLARLLVDFWQQGNFPPLENRLVVPVPLHAKRLRWRGFNQAEEIGRDFAAALGLEFSANILSRTRHTSPQAKLDGAERLTNVRDCFQVVDAKDVAGRNVVLIDDVVTTGSTVNECARMLKQAGANKILVLAVARG